MTADSPAAWRLPLATPDLGDDEVQAVVRVLRSGWLTAGPETERFEAEFAAAVGARHAIAVASGTGALHLANLALGVGPGDEVLCPSLTFVASANASRYAGARVVFADVVGADDLTVSPDDLAAKITARTRAITVVHYAGFPCRMREILALAERHGLSVIEDCAHSPLARCELADGAARAVGTAGDIGCFSFFGNKNMTTGEGGMLTTGDDTLAARLRLLRSHGMTRASWDRFRGHAWGYDVVAPGYNYRIDDIRSAIGRVQLRKLAGLTERRRQVFAEYAAALGGVPGVRLPFADRDLAAAAPHVLSLVLEGDGDAARRRLIERGIQISRHYEPVNGFSIYGGDSSGTPVAAGLDLVTLPFGPSLTREQVVEVVDALGGR